MSTTTFPGPGESKPSPWSQQPTETGTPIIKAPTTLEAEAIQNTELSDDDKAERFVDPLKFQKGGEVAIHGAFEAGSVHPEYAANQESVDAHPSKLPEAEAQAQGQDVA